MGDFIPGSKVDDSGDRKPEDGLELSDCGCCRRAVDSVRVYMWYCAVYGGDGV